MGSEKMHIISRIIDLTSAVNVFRNNREGHGMAAIVLSLTSYGANNTITSENFSGKPSSEALDRKKTY